MERAVVGFVTLVLSLGGVAAQSLAEGLQAAQAKIEAKEWQEALEILLPLQQKVEVDSDLEVLAASLDGVGDGLVDAADFDAGLRARSAGLTMRRRLYGQADHPDVALSLNNFAVCLQWLGRAGE